MANMTAETPTHRTHARSQSMSLMMVMDTISYWLVVASVYFTVGAVFFFGGAEKLFSGSLAAPASVAKQFAGTWLASFPGINALWFILGILEFATFMVLLASLVMGEFLPSHHKSLMSAGLGLALLTFACLSFGQTVSNNFAGAATQWSYLAGTAVLMLLVSMLPPNRPRIWISGHMSGGGHPEA
jgi:hypothetical protein